MQRPAAMTASTPGTVHDAEAVVDAAALDRMLDAIAREHGGSSHAARQEVLKTLKQVDADGRRRARARLDADGGGWACAARISALEDALVTAIFRYACSHVYRVATPSRAERVAVAAVGGYGRGTLAPGSDIDLLFLLPYKRRRGAEQVVECMLYMLWDMGFKVGHATRTVDECIAPVEART